MTQLAVIGHGVDTGSPPAFLTIGVFPDGTTTGVQTVTNDDGTTSEEPFFSNPAGESFTIRVAPNAAAEDVIQLAKRTYAELSVSEAANAQGLQALQAYIGQLIPAV
jgi:hypothetical protein